MIRLALSLVPVLLALQAPQEPVPDSDVERARAHYRAVGRELLARDVGHLTPLQRAERTRVLAELAAYCERGSFTRNADFPGARVPYFVDADGRLCAVANLLSLTGEDGLVRAVAAAGNHVWVPELARSPDFHRWLERVGLSFEEAVRIQLPGFSFSGGGGSTPPSGWGGPADTGPGSGSPSAPGPSGPPTGGAGPTLGAPTGPVASGGLAGGFVGGAEDWHVWWELNKLRWLEPNVLSDALVAPVGGVTRSESYVEERRRTLAPLLAAELESPHAEVRAAAAIAYARAQGSAAVPSLKELFDDENAPVRDSAVLALGATASEEGVFALLELLRADDVPTPRSRPLAIVALGVARLHERGSGVDGILAGLLSELEQEIGDDAFYAYLLHQNLAPSAKLAPHVRCNSGRFPVLCSPGPRRYEPRLEARARALETLRFDAEAAEVLPRLLDAVHGRDVAERRSAACGLAGVDGALEPLKTAFETEKEPLTRGFLLLSIAEQGGPSARGFLIEAAKRGRSIDRPWAALALGVVARGGDDEAGEALIDLVKRSKAVDRGAFLLALGIGRAAGAHDLLVSEMRTGGGERTRMYAALALGMIESEDGREALRANLERERSSLVLSGMAQALALYGDARDTGLLVEILRESRQPDLQKQFAAALGFHGRPETLAALVDLVEEGSPSAAARAAAVDAIGMHLAESPALALGALSRGANFTIFPDWMFGLLQHAL